MEIKDFFNIIFHLKDGFGMEATACKGELTPEVIIYCM